MTVFLLIWTLALTLVTAFNVWCIVHISDALKGILNRELRRTIRQAEEETREINSQDDSTRFLHSIRSRFLFEADLRTKH